MEASRHAFEEGRRAGKREATGKSIAQMFCLLVGAGLVAAGILGFIFGGSDFDTGSNIQGEDFLFLEVNGWHNVVHIATGAFLLLMLPTARTAATGALIFGLVYAGVTVWGFIEETDLANVVAMNDADNWLHLGLAATGILAGAIGGALTASGRRRGRDHVHEEGEVRTTAGRDPATPVTEREATRRR